jgi:hypothetical protein
MASSPQAKEIRASVAKSFVHPWQKKLVHPWRSIPSHKQKARL